MGGYLSGRPRTVNRGTVEGVPRLALRYLRRSGFVVPGYRRATTLHWSRQGVSTASIGVIVDLTERESGFTTLIYSYRGTPIRQHVSMVAMPCRFGGFRLYFVCPDTGARVETLTPSDIADGRFISCSAAALSYSSQSETELDRLWRAQEKAADKAFGKNGQPRPRGENKRRLEQRWEDLSGVVDRLVVARFGFDVGV